MCVLLDFDQEWAQMRILLPFSVCLVSGFCPVGSLSICQMHLNLCLPECCLCESVPNKGLCSPLLSRQHNTRKAALHKYFNGVLHGMKLPLPTFPNNKQSCRQSVSVSFPALVADIYLYRVSFVLFALFSKWLSQHTFKHTMHCSGPGMWKKKHSLRLLLCIR